MVADAEHPDAPDRVLKVALDDAAARRLDAEADALRLLTHPRIVKLLEGPFTVGGRRALLLEAAGRETLATQLGNRERLPLDLLERWGTDLLEALVALDAAGITHRDIKPANLGIHKDSSSRKHLKLFDFSLTKAAASDTRAGTPPYLDPFLTDKRQYDSAAERYAAAVVLFEMATGQVPVYGDGLSDPASIRDEVTIEPGDLDPSARSHLTAFFTRVLARDAGVRHDTAAQMLLAWRACFPETSVIPENADALAEAATKDTPLTQSGLTPRAISALEQLRVTTVGELALVDPVSLNHLPGLTGATKPEVRARAKLWRSKFGRRGSRWEVVDRRAALPDPHECVDVLLAGARGDRSDRNERAVTLASVLLGVTGTVDANATQQELAASFRPPVTRGRVSQLFATLQDRWADDGDAKTLLDGLADATDQRLTELGGVATFGELATHLLSLMVAVRESADAQDVPLAQGLLRWTIERRAAVARAESVAGDEDAGWFLRRREGRPVLLATRADLLEVAEALGRRADALVDEANLTGTDAVVPASRVAEQLGLVLDNAASSFPERPSPPDDGLRDGVRLARVAAHLATHAGASATGELHHRNLTPTAALRQSLLAVVPGQLFEASELRDRVQARFPDLPPLPQRPDLDALAQQALALLWDEERRRYRAPQVAGGDTTGLDSRPATRVATPDRPHDRAGPRRATLGGQPPQPLLRRPRRRCPVARPLPGRAPRPLRGRRARPHPHADGRPARDRSHRRRALVRSAGCGRRRARFPRPPGAAGARATFAARGAPDHRTGTRRCRRPPLLLTDPSLLARYDALGLLAGWMDLATPRPTAVWLVVPQVHGNIGPTVDGQSLPLTAPSQYVPVPTEWIQTHRAQPTAAATPALEGTPS
ncbi:MAG: protein kinase [Micropruina sp.]|nr:protein kinase [Micropruina sp.]